MLWASHFGMVREGKISNEIYCCNFFSFHKIRIKNELDKLSFLGITELYEEKVVNEHPNPIAVMAE